MTHSRPRWPLGHLPARHSTVLCGFVLISALCGGAFADSKADIPGRELQVLRGNEHKALPARSLLSHEESDASRLEEFEEHEHAAESEPSEEGKEGEEGEEGEEEEEEFGESDIQVAEMLLGAVAFVMVLLWLVNYKDDDVRRYAWRIISATMSIFTAVLFFQGNSQLIESYTEECSDLVKCLIHFAHCLLYLCLLGFTIVYISGSASATDTHDLDEMKWVIGDAMLADFDKLVDESQVRAVQRKDKTAMKSVIIDDHGMEVTVHKKYFELDKRKKQMRCWATLLAHMGGFAAIRAGGALQHTKMMESSPAMTFLSVIITGACLQAVFVLTGMVRTWSNKFRGNARKKGTRAKLTKEEVIESENDVMSLAVSFLTVQAVRFSITKELPNEEGLEPEHFKITTNNILALMVAGILFALLAIVFIVMLARSDKKKEHEPVPKVEGEEADGEEGGECKERLLFSVMNACAMSFAWCVFWGSKWLALRNMHMAEEEGRTPVINVHTIFGTVVMALIMSFATCVVVIFLDKIEDAMKGEGPDGQKVKNKVGPAVIQSIITSLGILVGFAWEHCFDEGVAAVASKSSDPAITKFILGVICVVSLATPWQKYILSKAMQLEELELMREEIEDKQREEQLAGHK